MFILLVEYGLVHRGDCINCETCYFCFNLAFVWPSLGRLDFLCLPELAGDARQWWQLGDDELMLNVLRCHLTY